MSEGEDDVIEFEQDDISIMPENVVSEDVEFVMVLNCSGLAKEKFETMARHAERVKELAEQQKRLKASLEEVGLEVKQLGLLEKDIMWGISASREMLMNFADRIRFQVPMIADYGGTLAPFHIGNHYFYQSFGEKFFREIDRQRLIYLLIRSDSRMGGAEIDIRYLIETKVLKQFFTLHDPAVQARLMKTWIFQFWKQPIDEIRDYFGEKLAIHFAWLGFYLKWLIPASIIGLLLFLLQTFLSQDYSMLISSLSCIFMSIWATLFSDFWKRKSIARAFRWKVLNYTEREETRPSFKGQEAIGVWRSDQFIDLRRLSRKDRRFYYISYYFPRYKRVIRAVLISTPVTIVAIIISMVLTYLLVYYLPGYMAGRGEMSAFYWAPILNSILIVIMSSFYRRIATKLTDFENHRTDSQWEDALIVKLFLFDFVNSYFSLFVYAFSNISGKSGKSFNAIRDELMFVMFFIFVTRIIIVQTIQILVPVIGSQISKCCNKRKGKRLNWIQQNAKLSPYPGTIDKYTEIIVQFGYVILFGVSFPAAPICALINLVLEIRFEALKNVKFSQRAPCEPAKDIGIYHQIIEILGIISIITNTFFLGFADGPSGTLLISRLVLVLGIENAILLLKVVVNRMFATTPYSVRKKMSKEQLIKEVLLEHEFDSNLPHVIQYMGERSGDATALSRQ